MIPEDEMLLRDFFERCSNCEEIASASLPSIDLILWRSRLDQKRQLARRAVSAIRVMRIAAAAAFLVLLALVPSDWITNLFAASELPFAASVALACVTALVLALWSYSHKRPLFSR